MVSDEDVLVLRFMRRSLPLSLDRFLTRFLVFRELLGVYAWDFFCAENHFYSSGFTQKKQSTYL